MCEPITLTTALAAGSLAVAAGGTAMSVIGQMNQQASMGAQANFMRQQAERNQTIQTWQANDALDRGKAAEQKQRQVAAQRLGTQTAALAGQGTSMEGSPTDILGDTAKAGELDALTVRSNAAREAWGYQVGASNAGASAGMYGSFQPSFLGAGASLLSGASGLADKWTKFRQNGALPGGGSTPTYGSEFDL